MKKIILSLILILVSTFGYFYFSKEDTKIVLAGTAERPLYMYYLGGTTSSSAGDYNLGIKFTPRTNGSVSKLWAMVNDTGTHTVRLYNSAGTVIASGDITGVAGSWVSVDVTPVDLTYDNWYVVSVRTSAWCYETAGGTNIQSGHVTINNGIYIAASNDIPATTGGATFYAADVTFTPTDDTATQRPETPYRSTYTPGAAPAGDYNVGYIFVPTVNGTITSVAGINNDTSSHNIYIYDYASGTQLATASESGTAGAWVSTNLGTPLSLTAGTQYVISIRSGNYYYATRDETTYSGSQHILLGKPLYIAASNNIPNTSGSGNMYAVDFTFVPSVNAKGTQPISKLIESSLSNATGDYNLGNKFTVKKNGTIDKLWLKSYDTASHNAYLWADDGTQLGTCSVSGVAGTWTSCSITPVNVTNEASYVVSARVSNYYYLGSSAGTRGDLTFVEGRYIASSNNFPNTAGGYLYGIVDVSFNPENNTTPVEDQVHTGAGTSNDYNLGYVFYPLVDGTISKLWINVPNTNTNTVRLYDSSGTVIASANITAVSNTWVSANITPVTVNGYEAYTVAVRTASYSAIATTAGRRDQIYVDYGIGTPAVDTIPRTQFVGYNYGVDFTFTPGEPAAPSTSTNVGNWSFILE